MLTKAQVIEEILNVVSTIKGKKILSLDESVSCEQFDFDLLDYIELVMRLEESLGIVLDNDHLSKRPVSELIMAVERALINDNKESVV